MEWKNHQEFTYKMTPNYLAIYIVNNCKFETIIDLGCGSGNESVYFLKKGKNVFAIDSTLNRNYILDRIPKKISCNVNFIEESFESVVLPKTDAIISMFSLPFCKPKEFKNLWTKCKNALPKGGILAANLFGERCFFHENPDVNCFTKEKVLELLKDFEIIKWKEQEYDRESDGTHWHYYDFVAIKK